MIAENQRLRPARSGCFPAFVPGPPPLRGGSAPLRTPDFPSFFCHAERDKSRPSPARKSALQASRAARYSPTEAAPHQAFVTRQTQDLVVDSDFVTIFC